MTDMPSVDQINGAVSMTGHLIDYAKQTWAAWAPIIAWLGVVAHALPWLPTSENGGVWGAVRGVLNYLGGNYRNAANKQQ